MSKVLDRFLHYVSFDTQSMDDQEQVPSTEKQLALAKALKEELEAMGASQVRMSEHGYVYAVIPATADHPVRSLGLCGSYGYGSRHVRQRRKTQNCGAL